MTSDGISGEENDCEHDGIYIKDTLLVIQFVCVECVEHYI